METQQKCEKRLKYSCQCGICKPYTPPNISEEEWIETQAEKETEKWSAFNIYAGRFGNQRFYLAEE